MALATPLLVSVALSEQQPIAPATAGPDSIGSSIVYVVGGNVSAPQLVSVNAKLAPPESCKDKFQGNVAYQFVLDKAGVPRDIGFIRSDEFALNDLAKEILGSERFHPASRNGLAVPVSFLAVLTLKGCRVEVVDDKGRKVKVVQAMEKPDQKLAPLALDPEDAKWALVYTDPKDPIEGGLQLEKYGTTDASAPVPLNRVEAEFSEEAEKQQIRGIVLIDTVVDPAGMPRDIHVIRPCGYGLDEQAVKAVHKYRFKPAMKNRHPIPARITVEINFQNK
ncbi:MAG TPA: energy transducer TonB [Terriglobales bacterium]